MSTKPQSTTEPTWRSAKAHEAISEAAEMIANRYCSEDDTYNLEVERLKVAISNVVDNQFSPASAAPVVDGEDDLHLAICQAVHLMNQGDLHAGHDLLRQTLIDYADKKAPLTRSEIIRQQQRSGSGEVSVIMVSPAAATAAPMDAESIARDIIGYLAGRHIDPEIALGEVPEVAAIIQRHHRP